MSKNGYRIIILVLIALVVAAGLLWGAAAEYVRVAEEDAHEWQRQAIDQAGVDRWFWAARLLFLGSLGSLIAAFFYNWPSGTRRGRLLVALAIGSLLVSWGVVSVQATSQLEDAITVSKAQRPAGLPGWCEHLYTVDPATGRQRVIADFLPPGGLTAPAETVSVDSTVTIRMDYRGFQPSNITIPADRDVEFFLFNANFEHRAVEFLIPELHIVVWVPGCHLLKVTVNAPTGDYTMRVIDDEKKEVTGALHAA